MWYSVKDGTHHVPLRDLGYSTYDAHSDIIDERICRGTYALVGIVMGWDEGDKFFGEEDATKNMKNQGFSILSINPYYRYSRR